MYLKQEQLFIVNSISGSTNRFTPDFLGFAVYISNTTDRLEGTLCFKEENFNVTTIPPVLNITCPMHGQYVIYYNERLSWRICHDENRCQYAYNDLCELEVYGMYFKILQNFFLLAQLSLLYIGNYIKGKENYSKSERCLNPLYSFSIFFFSKCYLCL